MVSPGLSEVKAGDTLNLDCKDGRNVLLFYEKSNEHPVSFPIYSGEFLAIPDIKADDTGSYFCYGQYSNQNAYFVAKAFVQVKGMLMSMYV